MPPQRSCHTTPAMLYETLLCNIFTTPNKNPPKKYFFAPAANKPKPPPFRHFPHHLQAKSNSLKPVKIKGYTLTLPVSQIPLKKVQAFIKAIQNVKMGVNVFTQNVGYSPIDF